MARVWLRHDVFTHFVMYTTSGGSKGCKYTPLGGRALGCSVDLQISAGRLFMCEAPLVNTVGNVVPHHV
jgi:hypothetical protein